MSKRVLLLLMAALTCMFIFAGCGGDDGDDADPAVTDALQAQIEALEAQLAANEITLAEYQAAIDALESDAEGRTYSESCTLCHAEGSVNDPTTAAHNTGKFTYHTDDGVVVVDFTNEWSASIADGAVSVNTGTGAVLVDITLGSGTDFDTVSDSITAYVNEYDAASGRWLSAVDGLGEHTTFSGADLTTLNLVGSTLTVGFDITGTVNDMTAPLMIAFRAMDDSDQDETYQAAQAVDSHSNMRNSFMAVKYYEDGVGDGDYDDAVNPRNYVSDASATPSCVKCHGEDEFAFPHKDPTRTKGDYCVVCHIGTTAAGYHGTIDAQEDFRSNYASSLVGRAHGIHNSGSVEYDGFEVGFPNHMEDCAVCHTTTAQLANATDQDKFTLSTCASCHGSWEDLFEDNMDEGAQAIHEFIDPDTDECQDCHGTGQTWDDVTIADIHNGTDYMVDKSWGAKVEYRILSASVTDGVASVTWQAVDPTNADTAWDVLNDEMNGEPAFLSDLSFSLDHGPSFDVAFFTGDDITNQGATTRDGQPDVGASFTTENTVAGDVSGTVVTTFTLPETVAAGTKAYFNIQGQPNIFEDEDTSHHAVSASAVYAFSVDDGSAATARRVTADMDKCLDCHGTLSLHGGNRINSVETCVICHNPNATDITGRNSYGDDVDKTLGGEQSSYDFSVMIHGIHAAAATDKPYYVYRSRGIYAFRGESDLPATFGVGDASWNDVPVHYPRSISSCDACHTAEAVMADQSEAIAVTIDQGADLTTHDDDTIIGPNSAACSSCHKGNITGTADMAAHLQSFGYSTNAVTKDEVLEAAE